MTGETLTFTVHGIPVPQGSKTYLGHGRMVESGGQKLKNWRHDVTRAAEEARDEHGGATLTGPLYLEVDFFMPRPRGHYGTGRNAHLVRDGAPEHPAGRPDLDKLIRAVDDALTAAGLWKDDAQVVDISARKSYADDQVGPGASISVMPLSRTVGDAERVALSVQEGLPL